MCAGIDKGLAHPPWLDTVLEGKQVCCWRTFVDLNVKVRALAKKGQQIHLQGDNYIMEP
jgi:hypothetical protein